jgi:hypothetical protein
VNLKFSVAILSSFSYFLNESQDCLFVCMNVHLLKSYVTESLWDTGDVILFHVLLPSLVVHTLSLIEGIYES